MRTTASGQFGRLNAVDEDFGQRAVRRHPVAKSFDVTYPIVSRGMGRRLIAMQPEVDWVREQLTGH
ncbi:MAG: hypothetical protein ABI586_04530, partial [Candidatus Nanopelagicales bacterium]